MARKTKVEVIAELKALGVAIETDDYKELWALLKKAIAGSLPEKQPEAPEPEDEAVDPALLELWKPGVRCRVEFDEGTYSGEITGIDDEGMATITFDDGDEGYASVDDLLNAGKIIEITSRIKKGRMHLSDAVRNERDTEFLNTELRKREYKGKIARVISDKAYEVDAEGVLVTKFTIILKAE